MVQAIRQDRGQPSTPGGDLEREGASGVGFIAHLCPVPPHLLLDIGMH